jgi:hypothetical protein
MTERLIAPVHEGSVSPRDWMDFSEPSALLQPLPPLAGELSTQVYTCVRLDWEDLRCFEVVNHQFQMLDVIFDNAIALRPSNPAYPPYSGVMVVMGAPQDGWVEATFLRPVQFVSGFVTSSRRTVLTAFDGSDQPIAQAESPGANLYQAGEERSANVKLSLTVPNIHRAVFHTLNGHLTLDDFCFGF